MSESRRQPSIEPPDRVSSADHQLIDLCLAGRTDAFGELVLRYQDRLYNSLVRMLGSGPDARDVAQEAFVTAFEKLDTFRREAAFYSWLYRIAYNTAISRRRKRRATLSVDQLKEATGSEPTDPNDSNDPSYDLHTSERQQLVRDALNDLAPEFRDVLILKEMDGLRYDEIAEIIDIPIGTVRSRIHRARHEMKQKLTRVMQAEQ